ncbi:MAG: tryptophan-rich sensory protein [Chloroflexota bacterium]|nr:tryptophan-rich sensory protein [Chloroflexota bacterium]
MKRFLPWINGVAVIVTLVVNGMANAIPLNGQNTGAISDRFLVFFVPAGYVFAIWGIIYIGLIAFGVYQALPAQRDNVRLNRIGYLFALSCLANSVWIFLWHYNFFPLTVVVMLLLLLLLIAIYLRLDIGRSRVTQIEKWCVDIPFSIYLGWISVATIANITDLLYDWNWDGFGINPQAWAVIMLVAAAVISLAMTLTRRDVAFLLVIIWAFTGIAIKQAVAPLVATSAWIMTALVVLMLLCAIYQRFHRSLSTAA